MIAYLSDLVKSALMFFYNSTGSLGIAIILVTIATRILFFPLTVKQTKATAMMKKMQPLMKAIQEKYKDDPQEQQKKMMELYKEHKYNPLSGCLPLLVQLPLIWAVFAALKNIPEGLNASFLIWDLTQPDPYYVLPILSGASSYFQMSMTTTDSSQKTMMYIMPLFLVWVSVKFQAGLVLYWVVGNILGIAQQYWLTRQTGVERGGSEAR